MDKEMFEYRGLSEAEMSHFFCMFRKTCSMCVFETENTIPISDEERKRMYQEALEAENDEYNYGHNVPNIPTDDDGYPLNE